MFAIALRQLWSAGHVKFVIARPFTGPGFRTTRDIASAGTIIEGIDLSPNGVQKALEAVRFVDSKPIAFYGKRASKRLFFLL